ncbi:MAG: SDR family oxidoreductase [Deltaproteobacteria bacterium]|nr:SDR family oxidoreductase [Deltaproteobacteria bacterium]
MDDMIIVGASGGIGRFLAEEFKGEYVLWRTRYRSSTDSEYDRVNVMNPQSVREYATVLGQCLSDRVILVNAAGISINGIGHKMPQSSFAEVLHTNLVGAFNLASAFLPIMRDRRWGRIINLSSVVGSAGIPGTVAYSTSKAGLMGLTRTLAVENAKKGITVNVLRLGYMAVGMIDTIQPDKRQIIRRNIPAGYFGNPGNIVAAIRFLVDAPYVTGTAIDIDGGFLCS